MEWYCRDRKNKYGDYNKSIKKYYNEDSNKWVTKLNKKTIEEKYIRYESQFLLNSLKFVSSILK
jgi:hypothetical protein